MLTLFILFIMRLFFKKENKTIPFEEAKRIANLRYPERYETCEGSGNTPAQMIDVNKIPRTMYICSLAGGIKPGRSV